jgi:N-acetylmuramoyl-L-alanine amidase
VEIVKKTLKIILAALFTIFVFFNINGDSNAYAQEAKFTPIMGESQATKEQAIQILKARNRIDNDTPKTDEYIENFVNATWEEAAAEGVRADITFSLMMLETNFLRSKYVDQNNFGGLGVFEGGAPASFDDYRTGIRAVVQHLKAYASKDPLKNDCVDPRYQFVTKGSAIYLEWLGQKENPQGYGWATAHGHGYRILNIYNQMCENSLTPFIHEISAAYNGSTYEIFTESINASGALCKFVAENTATGQETVIQDYNQNSTATWTPSSAGSYKIKAYIKRATSIYDFDAYTSCNVTVEGTSTTIKSFELNETDFYANKTYTATASASSLNKPLYKFWILGGTFQKRTMIQDYSEKSYTEWRVPEPGNYRLIVHVKDSSSNNAYDTYTYIDFDVTDYPTTIASFELNETDFYANKTYTATASASSLNKPLYKFWILGGTFQKRTMIQDYSEKSYTEWRVPEPGNYRLIVHVKDSSSNNAYDTYTYIDFDVISTVFGKTIVLDAGHGESDPGTVSQSTGLEEADLNLEQTLILGNLLKTYGFNVIYTRDTDTYVTLEDRVAVAKSQNADLFISIHHDSSTNTTAKGISTHYSTYRPLLDNKGLYVEYSHLWDGDITYDRTPCKAAVNSKILAEMLVQNIATLGFDMRPKENGSGAHDHNLYVTRKTTMPSVLIEAGFMSNDEEVRRVAKKEVQESIAQKIANTIIDFFKEIA